MAVYINFEEGVKRVMNNTKLYARLLGKFKADTNLQEIESALSSGDMAKAQSAAHSLKGLAGNLSLTELFEKTKTLEAQIKAGAADPALLADVKDIYGKTLEEADKVIEQNA